MDTNEILQCATKPNVAVSSGSIPNWQHATGSMSSALAGLEARTALTLLAAISNCQ